MNYRHAYHAGNFADVLKHALLCWILAYLQQKEAPLRLIDSHAGVGIYDLQNPDPRKAVEAQSGILKLWAQEPWPEPLAPYRRALLEWNRDGGFKTYPGSPALMSAMLRPQDRLSLCELHPEDFEELSLRFRSKAQIHCGDGYAYLSRVVPPKEKRGLVLIDPPFETEDEFEKLADSFIATYGKWSNAVYMLWYPIKSRARVTRFEDELKNAQIKRLTKVELDVAKPEGLSTSALIICNAPHSLAAEWQSLMQWLSGVLAQGRESAASMTQLAGE